MKKMKKHPSLLIEFSTTVKLNPKEKKAIAVSLDLFPEVFSELLKKKIIPHNKGTSYLVSLLLCGDSKIRSLNREHRGKDKITDVLSFPGQEDLRIHPSPESVVHLGDLAISIPVTRRQATEFKIGFQDEFIHLFLHGLIHLLGFDHEVSEAEEKLMESWEERALNIYTKKKGPK